MSSFDHKEFNSPHPDFRILETLEKMYEKLVTNGTAYGTRLIADGDIISTYLAILVFKQKGVFSVFEMEMWKHNNVFSYEKTKKELSEKDFKNYMKNYAEEKGITK